MNTMDKIREAVNRLDHEPENTRERAETQHLGLRALAMFLIERADDTDQRVADAVDDENQETGGCIIPAIIAKRYLTSPSELIVIVLWVDLGDDFEILAEYEYDPETDILTRIKVHPEVVHPEPADVH